MKIPTSRILFIVIIAVVAGIGLDMYVRPLISGDNTLDSVRKYNEVLSNAVKNYVDEVDTQKLTEAAIRGMLNELDPHSVYITAKDMQGVTEDFQGSFEGIGVEFDVINDTITVVSPIVGGPSDAIGILATDRIVRINDTNAVKTSRENVPKKLRGPKGTVVKLHIKRTGEKDLLVFDVTRDKIPLNSVEAAFMISGTDVGYVAVNRFSATTYDEIMTAGRKLRDAGMKKLMLDLRSNPGGYLDQAHRIADAFIPAGHKIVYTKGRRPEFDEDFLSSPGGEMEDIPLVVLINGGSASASEIVSGAVQDLDRGLVVGESSFGKGLVQRQFPLGDGSAYRLTISRYYTPSGRLIQRPYDDKAKYYGGEGREEGEEGDNIEHSKETHIKDRPQYKTLGGRTVYGGGGITPDYFVKNDTTTILLRNVLRANIFSEVRDEIMQMRGKEIRSTYASDLGKFVREYHITADDMAMFRKLSDKKQIVWNDADYTQDGEYMRTLLKAYIGRSMFGLNGYYAVTQSVDKQVRKALELFPEASKIAHLR